MKKGIQSRISEYVAGYEKLKRHNSWPTAIDELILDESIQSIHAWFDFPEESEEYYFNLNL